MPVSNCINNFAHCGSAGKAEQVYECLNMTKRLYGERRDHTEVTIAMNNLGLVKYDQGLVAEAEILIEIALQ